MTIRHGMKKAAGMIRSLACAGILAVPCSAADVPPRGGDREWVKTVGVLVKQERGLVEAAGLMARHATAERILPFDSLPRIPAAERGAAEAALRDAQDLLAALAVVTRSRDAAELSTPEGLRLLETCTSVQEKLLSPASPGAGNLVVASAVRVFGYRLVFSVLQDATPSARDLKFLSECLRRMDVSRTASAPVLGPILKTQFGYSPAPADDDAFLLLDRFLKHRLDRRRDSGARETFEAIASYSRQLRTLHDETFVRDCVADARWHALCAWGVVWKRDRARSATKEERVAHFNDFLVKQVSPFERSAWTDGRTRHPVEVMLRMEDILQILVASKGQALREELDRRLPLREKEGGAGAPTDPVGPRPADPGKAEAARDTLKELKWLDNAMAQWAIEHAKARTEVPRWEDLAEYLLPDSPLFRRRGNDVLGNPYVLGPVGVGPKLNPRSGAAFQSVTGTGDAARSFWGKYFHEKE